jgi:esterase
MDLNYRIKGDGPPLLLVHGLFGSLDNLGGLVRGLADQYQTIAMDMRNHGRSPHSNIMTYPAMADDLLHLMDKENIDSAHVFGHSMGGKASMQLALNAPDRVKKLIVGDIAPVRYGANHTSVLEGMQALADEKPADRRAASALLERYIDDPAVLSFIMTNWRKNDEGVWSWRLNLHAIIDQYDGIAAAPSVEDGGSPYSGPTLFIKGNQSDYVTEEYRSEILRLFPNTELRAIEGTGHWFHAEKTELTIRIIKRFLEA